eukprot:TRINITY_DN4473_c0_g1_i1.p1 TRINITY_DN4473_c0_g1~~TRINITY_DN4473_c0_g1_i1.p1  ORF type:complete len:510 (-),score=58.39 TRINITY_DN4473_c0_g1_i1:264-1793(-)
MDGRLVAWKWVDSDCASVCTSVSANLEIAGVLFNAATLHCQVAADRLPGTQDLANAVKHFQSAAGLWDCTRAQLANSPVEIKVTRDLSDAMLTALAKLALGNATHLTYCHQAALWPPGERDAEKWETLSQMAFDASQCHQEVHALMSADALRPSVPSAVLHQAAVWRWLLETRAFLNRAAALLLTNSCGEAVAAGLQARKAVRHAEQAAVKVSKLAAAVAHSKAAVESVMTAAEAANKTASQQVPSFSKSLPLVGSGRPKLKPLQATYHATCPEDPFKNVPPIPAVPRSNSQSLRHAISPSSQQRRPTPSSLEDPSPKLLTRIRRSFTPTPDSQSPIQRQASETVGEIWRDSLIRSITPVGTSRGDDFPERQRSSAVTPPRSVFNRSYESQDGRLSPLPAAPGSPRSGPSGYHSSDSFRRPQRISAQYGDSVGRRNADPSGAAQGSSTPHRLPGGPPSFPRSDSESLSTVGSTVAPSEGGTARSSSRTRRLGASMRGALRDIFHRGGDP